MYEALSFLHHQLTLLHDSAEGSGTIESVKVALVTGAFLLAGTLVTVFGRRSDRDVHLAETNAQRNYEDVVKRSDRLERRLEHVLAENVRLRELVRVLGYDPDADPDDVRTSR